MGRQARRPGSDADCVRSMDAGANRAGAKRHCLPAAEDRPGGRAARLLQKRLLAVVIAFLLEDILHAGADLLGTLFR